MKYDSEDIKLIRERYGINARSMSIICGFGENQWRLYESGEATPNRSNNNIIYLIHYPENFKKLLMFSKELISKRQLERGLKECFLFEKVLEDQVRMRRDSFCEMTQVD